MVKQHRLVFEIGDIDALVFVCEHCGLETSCKVAAKTQHPPNRNSRCSGCGICPAAAPQENIDLLIALRGLLDTRDPALRARLSIASNTEIMLDK